MAADESRGKDENAVASSGNGATAPATAREISEAQAAYIRENLDEVAAYPATQSRKPGAPIEFLYRRRHLLTRDRDLKSVLGVIASSGPERDRESRVGTITYPIPGLARIELLPADEEPPREERRVFGALADIERQLGVDKAGVEYVLSVAPPPPPATHCPATEPDPVPRDALPQPGISRSCCDGRGTLVAVVDTGFVKEARTRHQWLAGVTGQRDRQVSWDGPIERYGGHGTFIASVVRAMAPRAQVWAPRIFKCAGALYEVDIVKALMSVLDRAPDVISLSAGTHTWMDRGLLSFRFFVDGPLRECRNTVLVAAAGNEGYDWKFSPAEMDEVIGVGALGPPGDARAWFSNYGDWVKVFAPGQDLVQAFAKGTYTYHELRAGQQASFSGMARWSGTSFATPVVSGLIAARMSGTGESARNAANSLLRLARAQALPGVGPVLRPGQACLCGRGESGPDRPQPRCPD
jgi:subtilisin family serine protease